MPGELEVGNIVLRIRGDASGIDRSITELKAKLQTMQGEAKAAGVEVSKASKGMAESTKEAAESTTKASQDIEKAHTKTKESAKDLGDKVKQETERVKRAHEESAASASRMQVEQAAAYTLLAGLAVKAFGQVVGAIGSAIEASEQYRNSLIGLRSVANGRGIGTDEMLKELNGIVDAFFDVGSAATAVKNLLSRGYGIDQAIEVIKRLKDAATFGRQASYNLADAVVSATEGLKNENSILVDNAGVTKNVAKMWQDYAKQLGITTEQMTQQQKIEAEYAGLMQETRFQVGDLAKSMDTLSGQQASASNTALLLSQAYGSSMTPTVTLLTKAKNDFLNVLLGIVNTAPELVAGLSAMGASLAGFFVLSKLALAAKTFYASLKVLTGGVTAFGIATKVAVPWLGVLGAAIGAVSALITAKARADKEAAERAEKAAEAERERVKALRESESSIKSLLDRQAALSSKQHLTYSETQELAQIQSRLQEHLAGTGQSLDALSAKYSSTAEAAKAFRMEQLKSIQGSLKKDLEDSREVVLSSPVGKQLDAINKVREQETAYRLLNKEIAELERRYGQVWEMPREAARRYEELSEALYEVNKQIVQLGLDAGFELGDFDTLKEEAGKYLEAALSFKLGKLDEAQLSDFKTQVRSFLDRSFELALTEFEAKGGDVSQPVANLLSEVFGQAGLDSIMKQGGNLGIGERFVEAYKNSLANADLAPATREVERLNQKLLLEGKLDTKDAESLNAGLDVIKNFAAQIAGSLGAGVETSKHIVARLAPSFVPVIDKIYETGQAYEELSEFIKSAKVGELLSGDLKTTNKAFEDVSKKAGELKAKLTGLADDSAGEMKTLEALELLRKSLQDTGSVSQEALDKAKEHLKNYAEGLPESLEAADLSIQRHLDVLKGIEAEASTAYDESLAQIELYKSAIAELEQLGGQDSRISLFTKLIADLEISNTKARTTKESVRGVFEQSAGSKLLEQVEELGKQIEIAGKRMEGLHIRKKSVEEAKKLVDQMQRLGNVSQEMEQKWRSKAKDALGFDFAGSLEDVGRALAVAEKALTGQFEDFVKDIERWETEINEALQMHIAETQINPDVKLNTKPFEMALATINFFRKLFGLSPLSGPRSSGGGGSKPSAYREALDAISHEVKMGRLTLEQELQQLINIQSLAKDKGEKRDITELIYAKREEIRKAALSKSYGDLEHQRNMGQLNVAQEIAMLEKIKAAHQLNAEELREIDEKIYDARKRQRQEALDYELSLLDHGVAMDRISKDQEISMLDEILRTHSMNAERRMQLEERIYSLRKELSQKSLEDEKSTISEAFSQVQAALRRRLDAEKNAELERLDNRIKALNRESELENEAQRKLDYQERLAEKERELSVTKSARKRRELQAEIEKMQRDEAFRLAQLERNDAVKALQDEKKAVQDRYAELTDEENLRQEALRVVMNSNLEQMSALIASHGEKWKDAGAELAESLSAGLISGKERILRTIEQLHEAQSASTLRLMQNISLGVPDVRSRASIVVNLNGTTIREEADVERLAKEILKKID